MVAGILILLAAFPLWKPLLHGGETDSPTVFFLPVQGDVNVDADGECSLGLYFLADNPPFFAMDGQMMCRTDNPSFSVSAIQVAKGDTFQGLTLYSLHLDAELESPDPGEIQSLTIQDSKGNTGTYDIGRISIHANKTAGQGQLQIVEHTGNASLGSPYLFTMENASESACLVEEVDFGSLGPYIQTIQIRHGGDKKAGGFPLMLGPGESFTVEADLRTDGGREIYLVSPRVSYRAGNGDAMEYRVPWGTLGIPVDGERLFRAWQRQFPDRAETP